MIDFCNKITKKTAARMGDGSWFDGGAVYAASE